jgi:membrane protein
MSWLMNVPPIARARRVLKGRADRVWSCDRALLCGLAAFGNRTFRIAIHTVRGIVSHRIGLHAAALTYYTVFALVPTLVVALWVLRSSDRLRLLSSALPAGTPAPTAVSGLVGLGALLFALSKMFGYTEHALQTIAASGRRTPGPARLLATVAFLLIPPVALSVSGVVLALARGSQRLGSFPGGEVAVGVVIGFAALSLVITLLYAAAARARLPFASAAVGAALAALALPVLFAAFASFLSGLWQASRVGAAFVGFPLLLLWVFSSWYAILLGAEVALAQRVDSVLVHGAATFRLDAAGERRAGVAIMLQLTRVSAGAPGTRMTEDELARALRLPPAIVRALCFRLVGRGLLGEDLRGFWLTGDPDRMTFDTVADAIDRDPALDRFDAPTAVPASQRLN